MNHFKPSLFRSFRGFSMLEISLALAVVGLAMVSIFGLLGVGLSNTKDTQDSDAVATIVQAIVSDRRSVPYESWTGNIAAVPPYTSFQLPPLSKSSDEYPIILWFAKDPWGKLPPKLYNAGNYSSVPANAKLAGAAGFGYYYEVRVDVNETVAIDSDANDSGKLAFFDVYVSYPLTMLQTNRTRAYFSTVISPRAYDFKR
jgi:prepilin-type N-terminal cleavage/methylation domain-containing protein